MKEHFLPQNLTIGLNNLWKTPLYYGNIEDESLLNRVCQDILSRYNLLRPPSELNDETNILDSSDTLIQFKKQIVDSAFNQYLYQAYNVTLDQFEEYSYKSWIAGSKSGYSINLHNHSGSQFAAVFYLACENEQGGTLTMSDPRVNANRGYDIPFKRDFANVDFSPSTGSYIIMPSYVYHYTDTFKGALRLAMPVDLFLGPLKS